MLQPSETSSEDGPSTDVNTGHPVPASSTRDEPESEARVQHVESASQLQCGSDTELSKFIEDLSEVEWASFSQDMHIPATRREFQRTCTDIARVVHLTSLNIVIPAVYQMVDKDLPGQVSKSQGSPRPSSGSSRSSHSSISFIEDDVDVMIMKNGVLSKIMKKKRRSRASVKSSRSSLSLSQNSPMHGSQTSLVDFQPAPHRDELKTSVDLTKESVCLSVIESLGKTLIDIQAQSLGPDLRNLSTNVVEEVAVSVLRALKTSGQRDATAQETKDMLQRVSKGLSESLAKKGVALVSPVKEETHEHTLASTAEEAMDAVIQTMEDSLDDEKKSKPAKNILAAVRKVVRVLACQSTCLEDLKADALTDTSNNSLSSEQTSVSRMAQMQFNEEFHSKATLAVSAVLRARGIQSAFDIYSRPPSSASLLGNVSGSKPAILSRSVPALLTSLPPPVGLATKTEAFKAVTSAGASQVSPKLTTSTGNAGEEHDLTSETVSTGSACENAETEGDSKCDSPSGDKTPDSAEKVMPESLSDNEPDDAKLREDSLPTTPLLTQSVSLDELAQESLQNATIFAQSTASDIVDTVIIGIEELLQLSPSQDETDEALSILQGNNRVDSTASYSRSPQNDRVMEIWHSAQNMFQTSASKLKDFYHRKMPYCIKSNQRADAEAKKAVSNVLETLREELPKLADFESSDEMKLMLYIVSSMMDNVEKMEDENKLGVRKASSLEAQRSKTPSSLSSTSGQGCISLCPIVRHTYIDMSDTGLDHEACIPHNTLVKVSKVIFTKLGLLKDKSASSPSCDQDHSTVSKRVERVLSSGRLGRYSSSLTSEVHRLFLEGNKSPEAVTLRAGKSVSDSILQRSEGASRKDVTFQLLKAYSQESVKSLLLPLFHSSQVQVQQAAASRSCPTVLRDMTGEIVHQGASRSPSQILDETLTIVSELMESDIRRATSLSAEMLENNGRPPSLKSDRLSLNQRPSSAVLEQPSVGEDKVIITSMPLTPVDGNNEDHTSLVTLLVIRLLTEVQGKRYLSDDMLDMSRRLIDNVLHGFNGTPGISENDTCAQVNIHKIYRAIYGDLVEKFGSEDLVSKAMASQDPAFEETVIASLTNKLMQTRASVHYEDEAEDQSNAASFRPEDRKQSRRGILRFLPKMPKINLKKFKIVKKNSHAPCKGKATETTSSNTVSGFSSEDKPRRRNLFVRMICALTKRSS